MTHAALRVFNVQGEIGFQSAAQSGHSHIGVEVGRQFDLDVAAGRSELHVAGATELSDLDLDIAAGRFAAHQAVDLSDADVTADGTGVDLAGDASNRNIAADGFGPQIAAYSSHFDVAADARNRVEFVSAARDFDLEPNAGVAIAVFRITRLHIHLIACAVVLDRDEVAVASLLESEDQNRLAFVAGNCHVAGNVANVDRAALAHFVALAEILSRRVQ